MNKTPSLVPLWIKIFCWVILVPMGLYLTYAFYVTPKGFIPGGDFSVVGVRMTAGFMASRSFSMSAVLIIALIVNESRLLALVLVMRALTELQDAVIFYNQLHLFPPAVVMFLGEAVSIYFLLKRSRMTSTA